MVGLRPEPRGSCAASCALVDGASLVERRAACGGQCLDACRSGELTARSLALTHLLWKIGLIFSGRSAKSSCARCQGSFFRCVFQSHSRALSRSSTLFLHSLVPLRAQEVPATLLPGLVDLHNHGGGGAGFPEACTPEHARVAIGEHLRHGTTSLVASLVTATPDTLRQRVGLLTALAESDELAGIHLEGPFLSTARCGAQDPDLIQTPDADLVHELAETAHGHLVTMTVAPELAGVPGDGGVIDALINAGALPSFGHTDASWTQMRTVVADARARLDGTPGRRSPRATVTHLFNCMRPLLHRDRVRCPSSWRQQGAETSSLSSSGTAPMYRPNWFGASSSWSVPRTWPW